MGIDACVLWNGALRWHDHILVLKIHISIFLKWGISDEFTLFSTIEILIGQGREHWVYFLKMMDKNIHLVVQQKLKDV